MVGGVVWVPVGGFVLVVRVLLPPLINVWLLLPLAPSVLIGCFPDAFGVGVGGRWKKYEGRITVVAVGVGSWSVISVGVGVDARLGVNLTVSSSSSSLLSPSFLLLSSSLLSPSLLFSEFSEFSSSSVPVGSSSSGMPNTMLGSLSLRSGTVAARCSAADSAFVT